MAAQIFVEYTFQGVVYMVDIDDIFLSFETSPH